MSSALDPALSNTSDFQKEVKERVAAYRANSELRDAAAAFMRESTVPKYSYNFSWLGRPIIQYPQDMVAIQELIWSIRPDLVIETGIAHGGSLILSASMLALLDICDAIESGAAFDPAHSQRKVLGIDIDIRQHNRTAIEAHPLGSRIQMIQGSSTAHDVVERVREVAQPHNCVLVCLDSNHTHDHVLAELDVYASLVSVGSYCIVFDTIVDELPDDMYPDRPWGPGDNPKTAVAKYLETHPEFVVDVAMHERLLISVAPGGFLRRVS